jgi:hypothetical protein
MKEFILRFKIKTPDGSKEYFHPHFGTEQDAHEAAKRLSGIYYSNVEIFTWSGKAEIEQVPVQSKIVYKLEDQF